MQSQNDNTNIPEFLIGMIRTGVQVAMGWLITYLLSTPFAEIGILIRDNSAGVELFFIAVFTVLYRELVEMLASRFPILGWLNGYPSTPKYNELPKAA